MKITKFNSIKQHRIFKDFSWTADLLPFASKNLIYGWNGTGKTTLTEIFRALENVRALEGNISISFGDRTISGISILQESALPQVRVFNKSYVDENIFTLKKRASAIFYLGQESIEKQKKIESYKSDIAEVGNKLSSMIGEKQKLDRDLDSFCQNQANNTVKLVLRSSGTNPYNNYNKSNFRNKADSFLALDENSLQVKSLNEQKYEELIRLKDSAAKDTITELAKLSLDVDVLSKITEEALLTSVVSQVIDEFESNPMLAKWVESGLNLHKDEKGFKSECAFCKNPFNTKRANEIEGHFNDAYNNCNWSAPMKYFFAS